MYFANDMNTNNLNICYVLRVTINKMFVLSMVCFISYKLSYIFFSIFTTYNNE